MLARIKALCLNSLTIAWSYLLAVTGAVMQAIDVLAEAVGDPNFKDQVSAAVGGDPKVVGRILLAISVVTILARVRGFRKAA